ncbi:MAG: hypothetical protein K8F36_02055 [Melioribacteraceae bacterium]|nr:hypothetical protein [Melioribacteraceae bacterium]
MKQLNYLLILTISITGLFAQKKITEVDFLKTIGVKINSSGPVLLRMDNERNRIICANANSSSISLIDGSTGKVRNIPTGKRALQHLKDESFYLDELTGNAYLIGDKCIVAVYPDKNISSVIETVKQYESVTVDKRGIVFLAGRESKNIAIADIMNNQIDHINWVDFTEPLVNLNQTPPPPIRKVIYLPNIDKIAALDGYKSMFYLINPETYAVEKVRTLKTLTAARWHFAGIDKIKNRIYMVIETKERKVVQAVEIDASTGKDVYVDLPGFTEGVGVIYNSKRNEVYIPYDNHASVHVVDFNKAGGNMAEIKIPLYGNDGSALDINKDILYIASWAYGEIEIVDLKERKFVDRISGLGIIPHMFSMEFNQNNGLIYLPLGATAVNGVFGSAVTSVNPKSKEVKKIYTGWNPVEMIKRKGTDEVIVFNSEDEFAVVNSDENFETHKIPFNYPHKAIYNNEGNIYLSYGPHQSYWPTVYIWGAKNGIMQIDPHNLNITDRRIPRLAQDLILTDTGILYGLQNSWGKEKQFILEFEDNIREFNPQTLLKLDEEIERETIQTKLRYDKTENLLYLVKLGETNNDAGALQIIDLEKRSRIKTVELEITPTDLEYDENFIFVVNFDSNSLMKIDKKDYSIEKFKTEENPLGLELVKGVPFVINHGSSSLQMFGEELVSFKLPEDESIDNISYEKGRLIVTGHSANNLAVYEFDLIDKKFIELFNYEYPFGDTSFNTYNNSFYLRGQFADTIYELNKVIIDKNKIWITDFLAGKLFIIE